jgi:uncharacterized membrane protein YadS
MSSVVAVATAYGGGATDQAVVVKLARTLMIVPICLGLAALARRRAGRASAEGSTGADPGGEADPGSGVERPAPVRITRLVPWFLLGFLALAAAHTAGLLPAAAHGPLGTLAGFLITLALSAIGLSTDPARLRRTGPAPLLLGGCLWLVVTATGLAVQYLTGHL